MLFFDSPVNRKREGRGDPPVNGLWLDGAGRLPATVPRGARSIHGNHCLLRGLDACARREGEDVITLFEDIHQSLMKQDAVSWLQARNRLEDFLSPLMRKEEIMLYSCDGYSWHWKPSCNWRFWRLPGALTWFYK